MKAPLKWSFFATIDRNKLEVYNIKYGYSLSLCQKLVLFRKELTAMGNSTRLTLCDTRGPLNDLLEKLSGEDGGQWFDGLKRFLRKENPFDAGLSDINWLLTYEKLGMATEYAIAAKMLVLPSASPTLWIPLMVPGLTCNKVVAGYRKEEVQVYTHADDLDKAVVKNDRDLSDPYLIGFRRTIEADEENKGLSANVLATRSHKGSTLLERLILGFGYYVTTGQHLDVKCITLCTGSRYSVGNVPRVYWNSDHRKVYVDWYNPDSSYGGVRSRSAVSLPAQVAIGD